MQFSIQREALLKPLQQVVGVVERRQTLPVLANLLVKVADGQLSLTGTDLEVEMIATTAADKLADGEITIPARKFFDIVRALPDGAGIELRLNGDRVALNAGRSRFTLTTLPASEFPTVDSIELVEKVSLPEEVLRDLMERTAFAMANQDVRYYLNGMLLDLQEHSLRCVATDGHPAQGRERTDRFAGTGRGRGGAGIRPQPPARAPRRRHLHLEADRRALP
jgi:DNA polymerase-3 subunit beta